MNRILNTIESCEVLEIVTCHLNIYTDMGAHHSIDFKIIINELQQLVYLKKGSSNNLITKFQEKKKSIIFITS